MRGPRVWIAVGLGILACVAILLAVLPTVVRRIAVSQIRALTAREAVIDEVQLNLFTRRLAVRNFRLADREGREPLAHPPRPLSSVSTAPRGSAAGRSLVQALIGARRPSISYMIRVDRLSTKGGYS
jgi:heme exporter protein D